MLDEFSDFVHIYTDGSKDREKVASAAIVQSSLLCCRLPDASSIFWAELTAIILALDWVKNASSKKFVIFSDSLSSLQSINNQKSHHPLVQNILVQCHHLKNTNKHVAFCWVPSHVGIPGNEKADRAAKVALSLNVGNHKIPYSDYKQSINSYVNGVWQANWTALRNNKLQSVKPIIGETKLRNITRRDEESLIHRLRLGHTSLTHGCLINKTDLPQCINCNVPLTVKHILIDCNTYTNIRTQFFTANNMQLLFNLPSCKPVVDFLHAVNLIGKL